MSLGGRLRIRRVPVQILLGIQPGLETQPHYDAPSDPRVKQVSIFSD